MASRRWCLGPLALALAPSPAAAAILHGHLVDRTTDQAVAGATVILTAAGASDPTLTIATDERGAFALDAPAGTYDLTFYYNDRADQRSVTIGDDVVLEQTYRMDSAPITYDDPIVSRDLVGAVAVQTTFEQPGPVQTALRWRRDHTGTDDLEARVRGDRTATAIGGAPRLAGSPAIALELVGEQAAYASFQPIELATGAGGTDQLELLQGRNRPAFDTRLALARTSRLSATVGAPIIEGDSWSAHGVVLDQTAAGLAVQAMSTLELVLDDNDGDLGDGADDLLRGAVLASHDPDGRNDVWVETHGVIHGDDGDRSVELGVEGERLDAGSAPLARAAGAGAIAPHLVDRLGGRLIVRERHHAHGLHRTTLGGGLGGGRADGATHTDVRAFAGDTWSVTSRLELDLGLRWDRRTLGDAAAELWAPRLALLYDLSARGRDLLYAGGERVGHLDQVATGAWRDDAHPYDDQLTAGYLGRRGPVSVSAGVRARVPAAATGLADTSGFEGALRWTRPAQHLDVALTASTLERAAALSASWSCGCQRDQLQLTAIARATPDDLGWGALLALARSTGEHGLTTSLGVELLDLDDRDQRAAHAVLSASW